MVDAPTLLELDWTMPFDGDELMSLQALRSKLGLKAMNVHVTIDRPEHGDDNFMVIGLVATGSAITKLNALLDETVEVGDNGEAAYNASQIDYIFGNLLASEVVRN